jgi:tRNA dimethylallyltransferase
MQQVIIIAGPTGTGKTEYAIKLAKKINGELINADSRQVYKYLDIGTNKGTIISEHIEGIPLHLINIIDPDQRYDLYRFQKLATQKIREIINRNKTPIIVGGTGLYVDSILKNYSLGDKSLNIKFRRELEKLQIIDLQKKIIDVEIKRPPQLNDSDWNNPRRLIRYIERQSTNSEPQDKNNSSNNEDYSFKMLYPIYDWEELKVKINSRVKKMFDNGLIDETKKVLEMGFTKDSPGLQIMGYKEVIQYLHGLISLEDCINLVQTAHRQYARKQRTWFESPGRNYNLEKVDFANKQP